MHNDAFSRCHPLVNFIYFLGAIGCSVFIQHPAYLIASVLVAVIYSFILRRRKKSTFLGTVVLFIVVSAVNPLFNTAGNTVLFHVFGRAYTFEALCYGFANAGILVATITWFGCYNKVMTGDKFTSLFGNLSLSLLTVMILRMIPSLTKKALQISGARKSIGKGLGEKDSIGNKITAGITVLSAVTDHALEGSIVTADSMRSRGYGCAKRTSFQLYRMHGKDYILLALEIVLLISVFLLGHMGVTYTPQIAIQNVSWGFAAYCSFLLIPIVLQAKEAIQWRISISKI